MLMEANDFRALQIVSAGSSQFGVYVDEIATISDWREPAPLPHAPKSVLGVVSIAGRMLTVLELATLAPEEVVSKDAARQIPVHIVALCGDEQLALAVDAVGEVIQLANSALSAGPETVLDILAVVRHENTDVHVVNLKRLFPTAIQGRERRQRRF